MRLNISFVTFIFPHAKSWAELVQTLLFLKIILYNFEPVSRRQRISRIKNLQSIVLIEKMHVNLKTI